MSLTLLILYYFFLVKIGRAGEVGDSCIPNETANKGSCVLVTYCEVAIRAIRQSYNHPFSRCGFRGDVEIVCCPQDPYNLPQTTPKYKPTITTVADNKFGSRNTRVADRECQTIKANNLPPLDLHIIGGQNVSVGEFPFMVALGYERGGTYTFDCGGSLLSDTYVLSAAHCVDTVELVKPSIARMGVIDIDGEEFNPSTDVRIADIVKHPEYTRKTKYHDLALIKLQEPASFNMNLNPVCLWTQEQDPVGAVTVTGWGRTSNTKNTKSSTLLKTNVTMVVISECDESYKNWRKLPQGIAENQICAGDPQGLHDTCEGDSGGPLLKLSPTDGYYRLVGVTSFGRGCGSPVPGVYTRVAQYLDWIESVVWPN